MTENNDSVTRRNDTERSVPTESESEVTGTLEDVAESGEAQCRLCDHTVEGDDFGEIFEKLAEHGEEEHEWDDRDGWQRSVETDT